LLSHSFSGAKPKDGLIELKDDQDFLLACVIPAQLKLVGADEQESQSSGIEKLSESCLPELLSHSFSGAKPRASPKSSAT